MDEHVATAERGWPEDRILRSSEGRYGMQNFEAYTTFGSLPRGITPTDIDICFNDFPRVRNLFVELKPYGFLSRSKLSSGQRMLCQTHVAQGNWSFIVEDYYWDQKPQHIPDEIPIKVTPIPLLVYSLRPVEVTVGWWNSVVNHFYAGGDFNYYLEMWNYQTLCRSRTHYDCTCRTRSGDEHRLD